MILFFIRLYLFHLPVSSLLNFYSRVGRLYKLKFSSYLYLAYLDVPHMCTGMYMMGYLNLNAIEKCADLWRAPAMGILHDITSRHAFVMIMLLFISESAPPPYSQTPPPATGDNPYHAGYDQPGDGQYKYGPYLQQQQQQGPGQFTFGQGTYPLTPQVK